MKLYEVPRNSKVRVLEETQGDYSVETELNAIINDIPLVGKSPKVPPGAPPINLKEIIDFHHIDGMYSFCVNAKGETVHLAAWTEVEVVDEDAWWLYKAEIARTEGFVDQSEVQKHLDRMGDLDSID